MDVAMVLMLGGAGVVAGAINSIAGGGSLISFPAALAAGIPQVYASATNTVALAPGAVASAWAYRTELGDNAKLAVLLSVPAIAGSLVGASLLLDLPASVFETIVPWLIFGATLLILLKDVLWRRALASAGAPTRARTIAVGVGLLALSVYGGYFGAGMGIVTLALLALLRHMSIHQMNAMKTVITATINGLAAAYFIVRGTYDAPAAAAMAVGSLAGGWVGASLAKRVNPAVVRWLVVAIGVGLSGVLAYRSWFAGDARESTSCPQGPDGAVVHVLRAAA